MKISVAASVLSLCFVAYLARYVLSKTHGNEKMKRLSEMVQEGARTFLRREYTYVFSFVLIIGMALIAAGFAFDDVNLTWRTAVAFAAGAVASSLAGFLGMNIATQANSRTAAAAESGGVT
ncbi:MAG: sodium/proton-translocating pyrophosphatase, partial [Candidatus Hydrogenedentota bacterium]